MDRNVQIQAQVKVKETGTRKGMGREVQVNIWVAVRIPDKDTSHATGTSPGNVQAMYRYGTDRYTPVHVRVKVAGTYRTWLSAALPMCLVTPSLFTFWGKGGGECTPLHGNGRDDTINSTRHTYIRLTTAVCEYWMVF